MFPKTKLWLSLTGTVGLCWIQGQYFFASWSRLLSITNWGTDCVVRMLLQKQVDLGRDIPIRRNTCRSSSRTFILKTLINVEICCESNEEVKKCKKKHWEKQTISARRYRGSMSPKQHRRSLHLAAAQERAPGVLCVRERPLILKQHCQCLCVCAYICANVFLCMFICLYVSVFLYIYTYIYICTRTYVYIYIYTHVSMQVYIIYVILCVSASTFQQINIASESG